MLYYNLRMVREEKIEGMLRVGISVVINLILFTLLSLYLLVDTGGRAPTPIKVYLEEVPKVEEVKYIRKNLSLKQSTKEGKTLAQKGKEERKASPMEVERETGDVRVPEGKSQEEPSLLKEIEQNIKGREKVVETKNAKSSELGEMVFTVSSEGIGLSKSGRATSYIPPLPKIISDEPLSPLRVRVWIEPSGVVSKVQIVQRSGSPQIDQKMVDFVKNIRFEPLKENILQTGVIIFRFKGG